MGVTEMEKKKLTELTEGIEGPGLEEGENVEASPRIDVPSSCLLLNSLKQPSTSSLRWRRLVVSCDVG